MTKYIKDVNDETIFEVAQALKNGGTAVFKTDTVYGIGANAFDEKACERIYEIKRRPLIKPLCVLIANMAMLEEIAETISPIERKLIDKFWPGPLTIKFRKRANVLPDIVSAGDEYVRVRLLGDGVATPFGCNGGYSGGGAKREPFWKSYGCKGGRHYERVRWCGGLCIG